MLLGAILTKTPYRERYFAHLNVITSPRLNQLIGIDAFKWLIQHSFFKFFNPKLSMPKTIRPVELQELRKDMTTAELNHLLAFASVFVYAVILVGRGPVNACRCHNDREPHHEPLSRFAAATEQKAH
jgi:hypothetical protein